MSEHRQIVAEIVADIFDIPVDKIKDKTNLKQLPIAKTRLPQVRSMCNGTVPCNISLTNLNKITTFNSLMMFVDDTAFKGSQSPSWQKKQPTWP